MRRLDDQLIDAHGLIARPAKHTIVVRCNDDLTPEAPDPLRQLERIRLDVFKFDIEGLFEELRPKSTQPFVGVCGGVHVARWCETKERAHDRVLRSLLSCEAPGRQFKQPVPARERARAVDTLNSHGYTGADKGDHGSLGERSAKRLWQRRLHVVVQSILRIAVLRHIFDLLNSTRTRRCAFRRSSRRASVLLSCPRPSDANRLNGLAGIRSAAYQLIKQRIINPLIPKQGLHERMRQFANARTVARLTCRSIRPKTIERELAKLRFTKASLEKPREFVQHRAKVLGGHGRASVPHTRATNAGSNRAPAVGDVRRRGTPCSLARRNAPPASLLVLTGLGFAPTSTSSQAKPQPAAAVAGAAPVAVRSPAVPGEVAPGAAPDDPELARAC